MFNEYEFYILSKLKQEEMVEFTDNRKSLSKIQDLKSNFKAQVKTKPTDSTLCCEPACC